MFEDEASELISSHVLNHPLHSPDGTLMNFFILVISYIIYKCTFLYRAE
jgi:hypothetical protein